MSFLNLALRLLTYDDDVATALPVLKTADRTIEFANLPAGVAETQRKDVAAGTETILWDATRPLGVDGTTELDLSLSPLSPDRYRLAWSGSGTAPVFRVERNFGAATNTLTLSPAANATVVVTGAGPTYAAVSVGDVVLIPGLATGDPAGSFDPANVGYWAVIGRGVNSLTLARPAGESFSAVGEVVVVDVNEFIVFAPDGVQAGDALRISAAFSFAATLRVLAVAPNWVDLQSTAPLAAETAIPTTTGLVIYSDAKQYIFLDATQSVEVKVNQQTAGAPVDPVDAASTGGRGLYVRTGATWKLSVANSGAVTATVRVVSVPGA
jgi:hypothetical protein